MFGSDESFFPRWKEENNEQLVVEDFLTPRDSRRVQRSFLHQKTFFKQTLVANDVLELDQQSFSRLGGVISRVRKSVKGGAPGAGTRRER